MSMSVHVNADGSQTVITRREYSSLEAKNKYGGFDYNSFLDNQEKLLENHKSDFDYEKAVGKESSKDCAERIVEARREERKWLQDFINELKSEERITEQNAEKYFLRQRYFDQKV